MLKPSEVLMRAHNEGRKCGSSYTYDGEDLYPMRKVQGRVYGQLCALGFLIEPLRAEFDAMVISKHGYLNDDYEISFVAEKYGISISIAREIEDRYEGFEGHNPQPLNIVAEWLEGIGY